MNTIVGGVRGLKPRDYDQFFTKKEIAEECIKVLMDSISMKLSDFDLTLEPSFGDGAFVNALQNVANVANDKLKFVDIDARNEKHRKDFLKSSGDIVPQEFNNCYDKSGPMDSFLSKKRSSDSMTKKNASLLATLHLERMHLLQLLFSIKQLFFQVSSPS